MGQANALWVNATVASVEKNPDQPISAYAQISQIAVSSFNST